MMRVFVVLVIGKDIVVRDDEDDDGDEYWDSGDGAVKWE